MRSGRRESITQKSSQDPLITLNKTTREQGTGNCMQESPGNSTQQPPAPGNREHNRVARTLKSREGLTRVLRDREPSI